MSTRDETFVALRHFQKLRSLGEEFTKRDPRFIGWLRETRETARASVAGDSYVIGELDQLIARSQSPEEDWDVMRQRGLELIGSAERLAALQSDNSISADLRRAIEISVKEGYFSSWPVKVMLTAATVLLAILFGGTIYSTLKVEGVRQLAEQASHDMSEKVADFNKRAAENNRQLQDEVKNVRSQIDEAVRSAAATKIKDVDAIVAQAKETIDKVVKSTSSVIDTEKDNQIKALRDAVSPAVDDAKTKLADYLRRAPDDVQMTIAANQASAIKAIDDRRAGAIKAMVDDETEARRVLDSRRVNAVTAVDGAEKAATNAIMNHQAAVNSARSTAETEMSQATGAINNLRTNTQTSINDINAIVAQAKETIDKVVKSTSSVIDTEKDNQIKALRDAVSPAVDDAKTKLAEYFRRAPDDVQTTIAANQASAIKAIDDRRAGAIKVMVDDETEARRVLDSRRVNAVTAVDGAEKAATNAIMNHQAAVNSARGTAETEMSQATGAINNLRTNTQTSIKLAKDEVEARGKAATDQIDAIVATIPERVRKTGDSVVALNDLLAKYEAPVAQVIARLQADKPQSTLDTIAAVLGRSVLLMAIALGLAVLAVVLSIVAMLRGTGRRERRP